MYETITYDVADHVARITLNRPAARNALDERMTEELLAALGRVAADDGVRVAVLTGAGDKAFCAGADLATLGAQLPERPGGGTMDMVRESAPYRLFTAMPKLGKPIIARLAGHAIAGGLGLAVACDLVIAADDIKLGTPEVNVGLWPMMIMAIINRNVAPKQAFKLYYTGRTISAREAVEMGLITEAVPRAGIDARVDELASAIAAKSPIGLRMGREAFFAIDGLPFDDQVALLLDRLRVLAATEDAAEGVTAFLEKRPPRFTGR
jgi:enoyl-CoA hydratase/carnithine racemase